MTTDYMLKNLLKAGEKMRQLQKGYFSEKDPMIKKELLEKSKHAERNFDNAIFNIKNMTKQ